MDKGLNLPETTDEKVFEIIYNEYCVNVFAQETITLIHSSFISLLEKLKPRLNELWTHNFSPTSNREIITEREGEASAELTEKSVNDVNTTTEGENYNNIGESNQSNTNNETEIRE